MLDAPDSKTKSHPAPSSDQTAQGPTLADLVPSLKWIEAPDIPEAGEVPFNPAFVAPESGFCDTPIFDHFQRAAMAHRDSIAISDGMPRMTFGELLAKSLVLARRIGDLVPAGEAVGIFLADPALFPLAALGCFAAHRPFIALDRNSPTERNHYILEQSDVQFMILDSAVDSIPQALSILVTSIDIDAPDVQPVNERQTNEPLATGSTDEPAFILYTSGSTGHPKGIVGSERGLLERIRQHVIACQMTSDDVCLPLSSPCTIAGNREIFSALLSGAQLMMVEPQKAGLRGLRTLIRDSKVTFINTVPALARSILKAEGPNTDFATVRLVRLNGDRVLWSDLALLKEKMPENCFRQVAYSSTETTGTFWYPPRDLGDRTGTVPIGMMHSEVCYTLLAADGTSARPGEEGELVIRSRFMALGHWRHGTCVPGPILPDPERAGFRIFATGDLMRLGTGNLLEFVGRKDRQIKIDGQRVEPAELEVLLRQSLGVADVAVVPSTLDGEVALVSFIVASNPDDSHLVEGLRARIRTQLPKQLHPRTIHLLAAIPRLPSGKQDTQSLIRTDAAFHEAEAANENDMSISESSDSVSSAIERVWKKTLKIAHVDPETSWDSAGGTSLKLLRFVFQLETELDRKLPLDLVSVEMTPRELERAILALDRAETAQNDAPQGSLTASHRPLVFLFPGLTGENPSLAALRVELGDTIDLALITYPGWRDMAASAMDFDAMTDIALQQVLEKAPEGELELIGYSLGGAVAFNAAQKLIALGRSISRFCVLDNDISGKSRSSGTGLSDSLKRVVLALSGDLGGEITPFERASRVLALGLARPLARPALRLLSHVSFGSLQPEKRYMLETEIWEALQRRAFLNWLVSDPMHPLPMPIFLVRSEEPRPGAPADLGWALLTPYLSIVPVQGDHISMLRQPNRDRVREALTAYFADHAVAIRQAAE